jgi:hypothetical protein
MNRRDFLALAAAGAAFYGCTKTEKKLPFEIFVYNSAKVGHLVRESLDWPMEQSLRTEVAVVGAGIAGMAAAASLSGRQVMVLDLEAQPGGTALARKNQQGLWLPQGAHYDLEYPKWFGGEVLALLQKANVIDFDKLTDQWRFVDQQNLIEEERETLCMEEDEYRLGVLPDSVETEKFLSLVKSFCERVGLPSHEFELKKPLSKLTFAKWLEESGLSLSTKFVKALDYQMRDDYGADSRSVAAWAGLVYYAARPEGCALFAPPEGNFYFIQKLSALLEEPKSLQTNCLLTAIVPKAQGFRLVCALPKKKTRFELHCESLVYAAPKFTLPYVMKSANFGRFSELSYAPWLCINLVIRGFQEHEFYWQNEILGWIPHLIGFVDSGPQNGFRVLTAYYCFSPDQRKVLLDEELLKTDILNQTIKAIERFWDVALYDSIVEVHMRPIGHGMAIPTPQMLNTDFESPFPNMVLAGADTGRLPLMLDALDSGIKAANRLLRL